SILGERGLPEADWLATPGRPTLDQLARIPHTRGEHSGAAVLDAAAAWVECETEWVRAAASHDVVVGRVLSTGLAPEQTGAIVHHLGRLRALS
ncbi:MAG TPA: flavin reductase, partial [Ruania sp.]|nr:flavin reductase [Ruania sp.]